MYRQAEGTIRYFAAQIAARLLKITTSRAFLGFVPLIGPIASGTINFTFVNAIADSTKTYYQLKRRS